MVDTMRGQTVLVTGASSGIGRALALALARAGNRVVIAARRGEALAALAAEAPAGALLPLVWDVADRSRIEPVRAELAALVERIDTVVLNAGTCEYIEQGEIDIGVFERVMAANFFGSLHTLDAALPLLRRAPRPYVVGVCSMSTYQALPRAEAYGASKAALRYALESLRVDWRGAGIDVSVVSPGFVATPLTARNDFAMPFLLDADDAAHRLLAGMARRRPEIAFPRRLGWPLRLLALLPTALSVRLLQHMIRR